MMDLKYVESTSTVKPSIVDETSSASVVYIRRNIVKHDAVDEQNPEYWSYEEARLTKEEYDIYKNLISSSDVQQLRADIDYLLIITENSMGV